MFNINNFLDRYINIPYKVYKRKNFYMIKYYTPQAKRITFRKSHIYNDLILLYYLKQIYIIHINDLKSAILNIINKEVRLIDYKIPIGSIYHFFTMGNDIFIYKKVHRCIGFLPLLNKYFIVVTFLMDGYLKYYNIKTDKNFIINISNGIIICDGEYNIVLFKKSQFNDIKKYCELEFEEYFQFYRIIKYDMCYVTIL